MELTYYGHSCFAIHTSGINLLFDPFISGNELAKDIDVEKIEADFILISHAHSDHVEDAESIAKRTGAKIVGSWELVTHYAELGLDNGHPMNFGGSWKFDFGTVHFVKADHSSSFSDGKYGGAAGGFVIESEGKQIYYSGDTSLMTDMKLYGELFNIDLALLPIGGNFTMGFEHAAMASEFVRSGKVIGLHYDTFGFIQIDKQNAISHFQSKGIELNLIEIGQTVKI